MTERFKYSAEREAESEAKVKALEDLLIKKGVIGTSSVDRALSYFETEMGPFNGAKIVARAWLDPGFKARLLTDTAAAIAELDFPPAWPGPRANICRSSRTRPRCITSSSARCARVIPGPRSGCRRTGTRIHVSRARRS